MSTNQIAQVAQHLNVAPNQVKRCEEWATVLFVVVHGCRPRFVSKKVIKAASLIQVECFRDKVVIDMESGTGYLVRAGFDNGGRYLIKRFAANGKDVRGLDYSAVDGDKITDESEYEAVLGAIGYHKPSLVAYGMQCQFPIGYEVE